MFVCYICKSANTSIVSLRTHLNCHAAIVELSIPVKCCQNSCKGAFSTVNNLVRHIRRYHGDDDEHEGSDVFNFPESRSTLVQNCTADSTRQTNTGDTAISHVNWLDTIKLEGRDVGLETWSWSRDRSRPLFEVLVLVLVATMLVLVLVSEGGLEQDLRLCATVTLLVSKVETSK